MHNKCGTVSYSIAMDSGPSSKGILSSLDVECGDEAGLVLVQFHLMYVRVCQEAKDARR